MTSLFTAPNLREFNSSAYITDQVMYSLIQAQIGSGKLRAVQMTIDDSLPLLDFASGCQLEAISFRSIGTRNMSFLLPCKTTLTRLEVSSTMQQLDDLPAFESLITFLAYLDHTTPSYFVELPDSLKALKVFTDDATSAQPILHIEAGSSSVFSSLDVGGLMLPCLPANLTILSFVGVGNIIGQQELNFSSCGLPTSYPPLSSLTLSGNLGAFSGKTFYWDETGFSSLVSLSYLNLQTNGPLQTFPLLHRRSAETSMRAFLWSCAGVFDSATWNWASCGLWNSTGATSTSLSSLTLNGPVRSLPTCFPTLHPILASLGITLSPSAPLPANIGTTVFALMPPSIINFELYYFGSASLNEVFPWDMLALKLPNLQTINFNHVANRYLSSPADTAFTALMSLSSLTELSLISSSLNGTIPANFFVQLPNLRTLNLGESQLYGTIPGGLWPLLEVVILHLNGFTALEPFTAPHLNTLTVAYNVLESFPALSLSSTPALASLILDSNPDLVLVVPSELLSSPASNLKVFSAPNTQMNGYFPPSLTSTISSIRVSHANICGPVPELPSDSSMNTFAADNNLLTGTIPLAYTQSMAWFDVSNNYLSGTIPSPLRSVYFAVSGGGVTYFLVNGNSNLTGPAPNFDISPMARPYDIELQYADLSWCEPRNGSTEVIINHPSTTIYCSRLNLTQVCTCQELWIDICPTIAGDCASPAAPVAPRPQREMVCIAPPVAPPSSVPSPGCPGNPPQTHFICVNGTWTSPGSVLVNTTWTIPPGSNVIHISGNLTTTAPIVFNGLGSSIVVDGCVFLNGSSQHVEIELTAAELNEINRNGGKLTQTLISSKVGNTCNGSTDLSTVTVGVKKSGSCRKVSVDSTQSTHATLVSTFSIDNTVCNVIIIVPSVVGAIIVLTLVAVIVFLVLKKRKEKASHERLSKR